MDEKDEVLRALDEFKNEYGSSFSDVYYEKAKIIKDALDMYYKPTTKELPCNLGDIVYAVIKKQANPPKVIPCQVCSININKYGTDLQLENNAIFFYKKITVSTDNSRNLGIEWYKTEEVAMKRAEFLKAVKDKEISELKPIDDNYER